MSNAESITRKRIQSIDILRGLAMVIMALDHVRDYFHIEAFTDDPLNLQTTTTALYFTRWITHFCAPVFVFLSGVSIYLQSLRKTELELSAFVIKRGLWLIFAEFFIISLAWTFNPFYNLIPFQVIWTLGISMVILGLCIRFKVPMALLFGLGLTIVLFHNLLDFIEARPGFTPNFWWDFFHSGHFKTYAFASGHFALLVYPFVAWTGLMLLGYAAGKLFHPEFSETRRNKILINAGLGLLLFFALLRFTNIYGDPVDWQVQSNGWLTFLSFLHVDKYPPSLLYLCIMIGPTLIALAAVEKTDNALTRNLSIFGRTAFFYYIIHIYIIHGLAVISFFIRGHSFQEAIDGAQKLPFLFVVPGEGLSLLGVYGVWIFVLMLLYPICHWYDRYKSNNRDKWWLSYL
ncbi:MAG: DUF1624 domain-containing protein [Saprospiraceae bacterium]|nr:DUF1624 domain-containing protein [Saprospiraceae bacterium]